MENKEKYIDALKRISIAYYHLDDSTNTKDRFREDLKFLATFVKEYFKQNECQKQVQNRETNLGHYFEYLSKLNMSDFALIDGRVTQCLGTDCSECDFNGDCIEGKFRWLKQSYKEPTFKLSQFEYDLLNAYKNSGMRQCISNYGTLLELYKKGYFKDIGTSIPIHEILDNYEVIK